MQQLAAASYVGGFSRGSCPHHVTTALLVIETGRPWTRNAPDHASEPPRSSQRPCRRSTGGCSRQRCTCSSASPLRSMKSIAGSVSPPCLHPSAVDACTQDWHTRHAAPTESAPTRSPPRSTRCSCNRRSAEPRDSTGREGSAARQGGGAMTFPYPQ